MVIYGVGILAACTLIGAEIGELLGELLGIDANVGGVGFAMLLLIFVTDFMRRKGKLPKASEHGLLFWSALYIPVVIAMASVQNVAAAVSGGPTALLAGLGALVVGALLVRVIARIGPPAEPLPPKDSIHSAETEV